MLTKLLEITALHDLIGKYYATPVSLKNTLFTRLHVIPAQRKYLVGKF